MTLAEIQAKIEDGLPGARAEIRDPRRDGVHLEARVVYPGFAGKSLLEQHRMVYDTLSDALKGDLHALALHTSPE